MTRITSTILVVVILMNSTVAIMAGSGFSEDVGVTLAPGISDEIEDINQNLRTAFSPAETGAGETLFALFLGAANTFQLVIKGAFAAQTVFINLGFPSWLVYPLIAPLYAIAGLELIYLATGRNTI